jgi:hypothetical protein
MIPLLGYSSFKLNRNLQMQHKKLPQQNRIKYIGVRVKGTIFNATFRNISVMSWRLALLVEETGVPGKKPPTCRKSLTNGIT